MFGVLLNVLTVFVASVFGLIFNKLILEDTKDVLMRSLGVTVIALGVGDIASVEKFNSILLILSFTIGGYIGNKCKLEYNIERLSKAIVNKSKSSHSASANAVEGLVTSVIVLCVGALIVVSSLDIGLKGDYEKLYIKCILDAITILILVAKYKMIVVLAVIPMAIMEVLIILFATMIQPFVSIEFINQLTVMGGAFLIIIGVDITGIKPMHVADFMPAILGTFLVILL